jgi:hypothetical protein
MTAAFLVTTTSKLPFAFDGTGDSTAKRSLVSLVASTLKKTKKR